MLKFLSSVKFFPSGQKIFILFILKDKQPHYKKVKSYCSFVVLCLSECYFVVFFHLTFVILHLLASSTLLFLLILKIIRSNQLWYSYLSICHIKKKSRKMVNKGERGMIMDFQVYSFPEWLTVSIAKLPLNSSSFSFFLHMLQSVSAHCWFSSSCCFSALQAPVVIFLLSCFWGKLDMWEFKQDEKENTYRRTLSFLIKKSSWASSKV